MNAGEGSIFAAPSVSVKLSALHPRCKFSQRSRVLDELVPALRKLAVLAASVDIALTVDSEEADELELLLEVFDAVLRSPELDGWNGLGLAVPTYQKRAPAVIDWLIATAAEKRGAAFPCAW